VKQLAVFLTAMSLTFALVSAGAGAATICVSVVAPSCSSNQPGLQAALDAAEATTERDRVVVGAGTFDGPFLYAAGANGGGIDLVGQGSQTILTDSTNAPVNGITVVDLRADGAGNSANVSDLSVHLPPNATAGNPGNIGIDAAGTVQRVEVSGSATEPGGNKQAGVLLQAGETLSSSEIHLPATPPCGSFGGGVAVESSGPAPATISDVEIVAPVGIEAEGAKAIVSRSNITSQVNGIDVCTSQVVAEDSLFRFTGGIGISVNTGRCGATPASFSGRQLTIVGPGVATGIGVEVSATNQAPGIPRSAEIDHSIIRSVATAFRTRTQDPASTATATTSVSASDFEAARVTTTTGGGGAASFLQPQANIDADPLFADPLTSDFSLLPGSPAIDASFSPPLAAGESATDLAGNPRITDGDGDGVAERDMGALESPAVAPPDRQAPETTITKGPKKSIETNAKRKRVAFKFKSSEEGSTFECRIDKGHFKPCTSPFAHKFDLGRHRFQVRATDAAGNVDETPAAKRFHIRPA
jgi:hypothetical protein